MEKHGHNYEAVPNPGGLLLTWINFNPGMAECREFNYSVLINIPHLIGTHSAPPIKCLPSSTQETSPARQFPVLFIIIDATFICMLCRVLHSVFCWCILKVSCIDCQWLWSHNLARFQCAICLIFVNCYTCMWCGPGGNNVSQVGRFDSVWPGRVTWRYFAWLVTYLCDCYTCLWSSVISNLVTVKSLI